MVSLEAFCRLVAQTSTGASSFFRSEHSSYRTCWAHLFPGRRSRSTARLSVVMPTFATFGDFRFTSWVHSVSCTTSLASS